MTDKDIVAFKITQAKTLDKMYTTFVVCISFILWANLEDAGGNRKETSGSSSIKRKKL